MILGQFDGLGRPYVRSRLIIPRLRTNRRIRFLVDTGAYSTCMHPGDARVFGIPFGRLGNRRISHGIGGRSPYFREPAILSFSDGVLTRLYEIELLKAEPDETNDSLPSLLGRNVINHWRMDYDPADDRLEFAVRHADRTIGRR